MAELARAWARVVATSAYVPMTEAELEQFLLELVRTLAAALDAQPFAAQAGADVGSRMIGAELVGTDTLQCSAQVLVDGLLAIGAPPDGVRTRNLVALLAAMSVGYANALRTRTLDQQENVKRALLSAKRRAEQVMQATENRFREVFTTSPVGIAITDLDGRCVETNPALAKILACPPEELVDRALVEFVSGDDPAELLLSGQRQEQDGAPAYRLRGRRKLLRHNGETAWVYLATSQLRGAEGEPEYCVTTVQDLSELQLLQGRFGHQLLHDALTGVANRLYFQSTLESTLGQAAPDTSITLCCLNLDAFSVVNNGLGHHIGDRVLKTVAHRLEAVVAEEQALIARTGGDEFAVLIQDGPSTPDIPELVARINEALAEPEYVDDRGIGIGVTVGAIRCPAAKMSGAELFRAADAALHTARATGKRQWAPFDPQHDERTGLTYRDAAALCGAFENGEVELRYQPVIRLEDRRTVAVHGALSWVHRADGPLAADQTGELAELTGLSVLFGPWMLSRAGEQLVAWQGRFGAELDAVLRIRLSRLQSADDDLVAAVLRATKGSGVPPRLLEIGFDTGAVLDEFGSAPDNLGIVADIGVRAALCCFHGGPTELALLARSSARSVILADPFNRKDDVQPPVGSAVPRAIEQLVTAIKEVGAVVSVDGVRTETEAAWWAGIGVHCAQGPLFGGPTVLEGIVAAGNGQASR